MFKKNDFIGLALDGDVIRVAHLKKAGGVLHLQKLDKVTLKEAIEAEPVNEPVENQGSPVVEPNEAQDDVFGFQADDNNTEEEEEFDFEDLEAEAQSDPGEPETLDMVDESTEEQSNAFVLYNIFNRYGDKSIELGLNIPAGDTIFQVIGDTDFREVKKKNLEEDLESKLESVYGEPPSDDHYSYHVREDGSLILASVKEKASLLSLTDEAREFYGGKIRIRSIFPDEAALASLVRANDQLEASDITAVIQFGTQSCRFFFMKGKEIMYVAPLVTQGTNDNNVLSNVFSKLLFELDTGKVPGVDQIILADNLIGDQAVTFFQNNFPNITVRNLEYNEEIFQSEAVEPQAVNSFTTAIGAAWAASERDSFSELSFLPDYVKERQKIFKLAWHGIALLVLIFFVPLVFNHYYTQNSAKISSLNSELENVNARITQLEPIVQRTQEISQNLALLMGKLSLIDSLSTGSKVWSSRFSILNNGMSPIAGSWFTSMTKTQEGTFIEGYTLYRNRVPAVVDVFAGATLLNVNIENIRGEEIYRFSILVNTFTADSTIYSPDQPQNIRKMLSD